ncbi:hypothetical protein Leryth_007763 [Lithospermum erythrorhizon]|nr:hypothetical protein Leryth_007763 [Lithospermum erythrorhizon]
MSCATMATSGFFMSSATPRTSSQAPTTTPQTSVPVRTIPGSYGFPVLGPLSDRLDYYWFQGQEAFFKTRIEKNKSTVFRTNVPPSFPFFLANPNVVAVLDVKSFSHMFDMEIVEKQDVLVGDFMPSVSYTGGLRVCAYLDTSEPSHTKVKNFAMDLLKRSSSLWIPTLVSKLNTMWDSIEDDLSKSTSASLPLPQFLFSFLTRCFIGAETSTSPEIDANGADMMQRWLFLQLLPTVPLNILQPLPEIFIHSFAYPFFLVQGDYNKLVQFVETQGQELIQRAGTEFNLTPQEAIHNVLFILGFNAFGGFSIFFPSLVSALESQTTKGLQEKLREEVRQHCGTDPGKLTFESVKKLELVQSFVYETLRMNPPVPLQYARARKDFELSSYEQVFEIKKGELLCGYQPLVMKDARVYENPEEFVPERFVGEKGKELLNYLFWSNGPQSGTSKVGNKQCAAKDFVPLTATLFIAYLFQRYDSVSISSGSITGVVKA